MDVFGATVVLVRYELDMEDWAPRIPPPPIDRFDKDGPSLEVSEAYQHSQSLAVSY